MLYILTEKNLRSSQSRFTKLPVKFHPPKDFQFPKCKFGSKGEEWSFHAEWWAKFLWVHYDVSKDVALCHVCMKAEFEKKLPPAQSEKLPSLQKVSHKSNICI